METTIKETLQQAGNQILPAPNKSESGKTSVFSENFGKFERRGSTYTHKIYMARRNDPIVGFSKPLNQFEPADKMDLLKKIVRRLANNSKNYLGPGCRVEFYHNRSDSDLDTIRLFTLYPDRYDPNPHVIHYGWMIDFLNQFYTPIVSQYVQDLNFCGPTDVGVPVGATIRLTEVPITPTDRYSKSRRFSSLEELRTYCNTLIAGGEPTGRVGDYMFKMSQRLS